MSLQPLKITAISMDDSGGANIIPNASFSVVNGSGGFPQLWEEREGLTPVSNPGTCDANGERQVWVEGGYYSISVGGGQSWEVDLVSAVAELENYAAVRALNGSSFTQVSVAGHTDTGDGGQGVFVFDPLDTTSSDNGATILVDAGGGRWKRVYRDIEIGYWGISGNYGDIIPKATLTSADDLAYSLGKPLKFHAGQFCINYTFTKKSVWHGEGSPELAPFPQLDDDKIFLRPGYKDQLPGTSIFIMSGTATAKATVRSDMFSTMNPAIISQQRYPSGFNGMAIVMDMDVLDSGGSLTTPATDNRATGFDVGLLLDDSSASDLINFTVFGYWNKAGIAIYSSGVGDNPDYTKFAFGSTCGYYGLALIGHDTAAGNGQGLSGTQAFGWQIFGNDHHSRQPQTLVGSQTNKYGHCLFIDGKTAAVNANLNGTVVFGGGLRTYSNRPIVLDNASNLSLQSVPFEFPEIVGQPDTLNTEFTATSNTFNVYMRDCRNNDPSYWDTANFGDVINNIQANVDLYGANYWGSGGRYVGLLSASSGLAPRVLFTKTPSSSVNDFAISYTTGDDLIFEKSGADKIILGADGLYSVGQLAITTISSGDITISSRWVGVRSEVASSPDDLVNILPLRAGAIVTLNRGNSAENITVKHGTGNIRFPDSTDKTLDNSFKSITLICNGAQWYPAS